MLRLRGGMFQETSGRQGFDELIPLMQIPEERPQDDVPIETHEEERLQDVVHVEPPEEHQQDEVHVATDKSERKGTRLDHGCSHFFVLSYRCSSNFLYLVDINVWVALIIP